MDKKPIGVFDSGFGGLTILKELEKKLPEYDFLYLGDNARAPYGNRSFDTVYEYTLQAVKWFFNQGCSLVILACNTASAKALRTIQQQDLPLIAPDKRVLGVIRPTAEIIGNYSKTKCIGIMATEGTVRSKSYILEIEKFFPEITVAQQACPTLVPIIENHEIDTPGAAYFIDLYTQNLMQQNAQIDTVLLACTHYPLIQSQIQKSLTNKIQVLSQGVIVAASLADYLLRHPLMENQCSKNGVKTFFTTDNPKDFDAKAAVFYGKTIKSKQAVL